MFYIRTEEGIKNINKDVLAHLMKTHRNDLMIGFSDYSIEFIWDGNVLYPTDRDNSVNNINMDFNTIENVEEMAEKLLSYGQQIILVVETFASFSFPIFITDCNFDNEYLIKDLKRALSNEVLRKKYKLYQMKNYKVIEISSGGVLEEGILAKTREDALEMILEQQGYRVVEETDNDSGDGTGDYYKKYRFHDMDDDEDCGIVCDIDWNDPDNGKD